MPIFISVNSLKSRPPWLHRITISDRLTLFSVRPFVQNGSIALKKNTLKMPITSKYGHVDIPNITFDDYVLDAVWKNAIKKPQHKAMVGFPFWWLFN